MDGEIEFVGGKMYDGDGNLLTAEQVKAKYPNIKWQFTEHPKAMDRPDIIPTEDMLRPKSDKDDDQKGPWVCVRLRLAEGTDGWIYGELIGADNGWFSVYVREREQVHNINPDHIYQWVDTEPGQWEQVKDDNDLENAMMGFPYRPK